MIRIDLDTPHSGSVQIGRQGEYDFCEIEFVMSQWAAQHPEGMVSVVYERPDGMTYPVVAGVKPGLAVWKPNGADLSVAGAGRLEARITTASGLGKSATIPVTVAPAIGGVGTVPISPIPDWTYTVADNAARAEKAATEAERAATGVEDTVNTALQQAKDSGAFTGAKGDKGDKGDTGPVGPQGPVGPVGPVGVIPKPLGPEYMPEGYLNWENMADKPFDRVAALEGIVEEQEITLETQPEARVIPWVPIQSVTAPQRSSGFFLAPSPFRDDNDKTIPLPRVEGLCYRVTVDETVYQRRAAGITMSDGLTYLYIGNAALMGAGENTGEPFMVVWYGTGGCMYAAEDGETHAVTVDLLLTGETLVWAEKPFDDTMTPADGGRFRVNFDGVDYECTCQNLGHGLYLLGRGELVGIENGKNEPYPFGILWIAGSFFFGGETAGAHRVEIWQVTGENYRIWQNCLPFGEIRGKRVVRRESVTTTTLANGFHRGPMNQFDESIPLALGWEYVITYDGVSYPCTAYAFGGVETYPCLGNSALGNTQGEDTGEPFLLVHMGRYWLHYTAEAGDHTMVMELWSPRVVPLEERYIPELSSIVLRSSTEGSVRRFRITVDDAGVLTAQETE